MCLLATGYRLCVYASGSLITVILNCVILIRVTCLHFGQNRGKFFNSVSSLICTLVLFLQIGQRINSVCIYHYNSLIVAVIGILRMRFAGARNATIAASETNRMMMKSDPIGKCQTA